MVVRLLVWGLAALVAIVLLTSAYLLGTYDDPPVDPDWAAHAAGAPPDGALTVRYTGTSTLLFSDGETDWMVDGWFSRFGPLTVVFGEIAPDVDAIARGLERNEVDTLAAVIPVHSHYDHAMDAPEVARRTGAILLGSESTANIARGWGLDEEQIRIAVDREPVRLGRFTITLVPTRHFQFPDPAARERALADPEIESPLVPPVPALAYRVGQPYAIHVAHPRGRFLVQGSAGWIEGGLEGYDADVVFLGIGGLGGQTPDYREAYWRETVTRIGARRIIPVHWDSLTAPAEGPFRGTVRAARVLFGGGGDRTLAFLREKLAEDPGLEISTLPRFEEIVLFP
jgi:L-ascorbate metabolism protein UlaG (beta-lactamase superfamily)